MLIPDILLPFCFFKLPDATVLWPPGWRVTDARSAAHVLDQRCDSFGQQARTCTAMDAPITGVMVMHGTPMTLVRGVSVARSSSELSGDRAYVRRVPHLPATPNPPSVL